MGVLDRILSLGAWVAVGAATLTPLAGQAGDFLYHFDSVFGGSAPSSPHSPWVDACFQTISPGTVRLSVSNLTLTGSENVDQLYFNLNPSLSPTGLSFHFVGGSGGFDLPTIATGTNQFKAGGDGKYDVLFTFSSGGNAKNRFTAHEYMTWDISGISGLAASEFAYLSAPAGGAGPFFAATHIQRIGNGAASGWIAPSGITPIPSVPEPGAAALFCLATSAAFALRRWRRGAKTVSDCAQLDPTHASQRLPAPKAFGAGGNGNRGPLFNPRWSR